MKDNWKRNSAQIKKLAASKAAPSASDIDSISRVPHKKKVVTSVLPDRNNQGKKISKHKYYQRYCVLCKKSVMPERKFKSHISEECFWRRFYQESIKEGLGKILVNNNKDVKNFQKSKKKCKRELKYIKKQNYIYIAWSWAPAHVVSWRRSRKSALRFPIIMSPLASVDIEMILITPSLVKFNQRKEDSLMNAIIWTS